MEADPLQASYFPTLRKGFLGVSPRRSIGFQKDIGNTDDPIQLGQPPKGVLGQWNMPNLPALCRPLDRQELIPHVDVGPLQP